MIVQLGLYQLIINGRSIDRENKIISIRRFDMAEVNIEKIMQEIRGEIKDKGINQEILEFDEFAEFDSGYRIDETSGKFDLLFFYGSMNKANAHYLYEFNRPIYGNPISVLIKKTIRKITRFYVQPLAIDQMQFNTYNIQALNCIRDYIIEQEKNKVLIDEMSKKIESLEKLANNNREF